MLGLWKKRLSIKVWNRYRAHYCRRVLWSAKTSGWLAKILGTSELEFVLFKGLERRWTGSQGVVFRDAIEDMNAAVVQQRRL